MSVLETVRSKVKELTDPNGPASGLLSSAKTAMVHGLDGAGKFVDEKTHGKYASQISTGVGKAKEFLGDEAKKGEAGTGTADAAGTGTTPSAGAPEGDTEPQAPSSAPQAPDEHPGEGPQG